MVDKDEARILIICEGRAHLQVDGEAIGPIGPGDILILTGRCRQVYRTVQPNQSTRLLAFRIVLHRDHLVLDPSRGGRRGSSVATKKRIFEPFCTTGLGASGISWAP